MEIEAGLYSKLSGTAAVTALVGTRMYPLAAPQTAAMPNLAWQWISGRPGIAHGYAAGTAAGTAGAEARIQITCLAATYTAAKALAAAVRTALHGASGSWGGLSVGECRVDNERDEYSRPFTASVVRLDVMVWYAG